MVGKTIESAQSRVEGYNFDIRKRVVEFDDVINRQRETIYAERDKVLRNEDLTETIGPSSTTTSRSWWSATSVRLEGARDRGGLPTSWSSSRGWASRRTRSTRTSSWIGTPRCGHGAPEGGRRRAARGEGEGRSAPELWASIERYVLLRSIDSLWVEHLTELDDMRRGIGLRGYCPAGPAQRVQEGGVRPLRGAVGVHPSPGRQHDLSRLVQPQQPQAPAGAFAMRRPGQPGRGGAGARGLGFGRGRPAGPRTLGGQGVSGTAGAARPSRRGRCGRGRRGGGGGRRRAAAARAAGPTPGYTPSGAKIGRNDACWCGSGLKYKKCHGR